MWTRMSLAAWKNCVMALLTLTIGCTATRERLGWGRRESPLDAALPAPNPQEYQAYAASARTAPTACCSKGGGCGAGSTCGSQGGCGGLCGRSAMAAVSPSARGPSQNSTELATAAPAQAATVLTAPYGGQKLCPVTDEKLGSMGPPVPMTVKGQTIYVCCAGCVAAVDKDPDLYLAKVAQERGTQ